MPKFLFVLVTLDVKVALNSVSWSDVLQAMQHDLKIIEYY